MLKIATSYLYLFYMQLNILQLLLSCWTTLAFIEWTKTVENI